MSKSCLFLVDAENSPERGTKRIFWHDGIFLLHIGGVWITQMNQICPNWSNCTVKFCAFHSICKLHPNLEILKKKNKLFFKETEGQDLRSKLSSLSFWTLCILSFTFQIQVQARVVQLLFLNDQLLLMTKPQVFWDSSEEVVVNLILSMVFVQTVLWDMPDT